MAVDAARAKSLFLNASDLSDPAERAAYLERECGDDAELRGRVEALLRANDASPLPPPGTEAATIDSHTGRPAPAATGVPTPKPDLDPSPVSITADYHITAEPNVLIAGRYTLQRKNRRRRHGRSLGRQAIRAGQTQGRARSSSRPAWTPRAVLTALRAGAAGAGDDGPSQHRQGARRRPDAQRPAVLRHGTGQRPAAAQVLRRGRSSRPKSGWNSSCRSARRCSTLIRRASCIATSSRPTS